MTLHEKFKKLNIDFSQLGLEPGDTRSDYFCTPRGASVIGWAGVDGIHCCFVKGFEEMVFAVNPSNLSGEHVHPLARNFEDFLRLILACGLDAAEQAWMWNRGEFDAFTETYPPNLEQQAVLDRLRDELGLAPMDDPYGYIRAVQSAFDYGKIPYSKKYYELIPEKSAIQEPPEHPEWQVYFANGFYGQHTGHDRPGKEISVGKTFTWGGRVWYIPAVYSCGKGLVVDFCMKIEPDTLQTFLEKWWPHGEGGRDLIPEEQEQQDTENPMTVNFRPKLTVNGNELRRTSGNGSGWVPLSCRPQEDRGAYSRQDRENLWIMEHYGLDPDWGWMFWRESFLWTTKNKPILKTVSLLLEQDPVSVPGIRFTVSTAGDNVSFTHPITGELHTLHVVDYETQEIDMSRLGNDWEYPTHCTAMTYVVEPELSRQSLTVRDCGQGDRPRPKPLKELNALATIGGADGPTAACSIGIIGGADGPTTIVMTNSKSARSCVACSSLYFQPPEQIEWRMVFRQKTIADIKLDLPLSQN